MPVRINYFKKLCELCRAFGTARNRRELLEMIFASAMEILGGKAACLYMTEAGKQDLLPLAQKGLSESYFKSRKSRLVSKIVPLVLHQGFFIAGRRRRTPNWNIPMPKRRKASPRSCVCR